MPYSDNLYSAWDDSDGEDDLDQLEPQIPGPDGHRPAQRQVEPGHGAGGAGSSAHHSLGDHDESNDDFLSPTDGYFQTAQYSTPSNSASSNAPYIPNVVVVDPSLPLSSTAASKAQEANQERVISRGQPRQIHPQHPSRNNSTPSSQWDPGSRPEPARDAYYPSTSPPYRSITSTYTPSAPQRTTYDESSLFIPAEAPPAYTPSPTSSSSSPDSVRNYNTFSPVVRTAAAMGGRDETQGLLANEPESMGNPDDIFDNAASPWGDRLRNYLRHRRGRLLQVILLSLLLTVMTVGFLTAAIAGAGAGHAEPGLAPKEPATTPPTQEKPFEPIVGRPPMDPDDDFNWGGNDKCKDGEITRHTKHFEVSFSPTKRLVISQDIRKYTDGHAIVNVHGSVILRRVGSGTPGPSAVVEVAVNDDRIDVNISWDADEQTLVVTVPHRLSWDKNDARPCVDLKITLWVPEDGALDSLLVQAVHLGIALLDDLSISVAGRSKFSSVVGSITAAATGSEQRDNSVMNTGAPDSFRLQSRFIEVSGVSGVVKGSWPLYDYLSVQTVSGNVKIGVEPQEAAKEEPKPAILYIKSTSGDVEFHEPIHTASEAYNLSRTLAAANKDTTSLDLRAETVLPPRDYRLDVHTSSGSIRASAAFSSTCGFKTTSGIIHVDLLPVLDASLPESESRSALLKTSSTSGNNDITVIDPLWVDSTLWKYVDLPLPSTASPFLPPPKIIQASRTPSKQERDAVILRALRALGAEHSTTSANVKVTYPAAWEGMIQLSTMSGKLLARGEGVEIISGGGHGWPKKPLVAKKGQDKPGWINVGTVSGNVDVLVGQDKNSDS